MLLKEYRICMPLSVEEVQLILFFLYFLLWAQGSLPFSGGKSPVFPG